MSDSVIDDEVVFANGLRNICGADTQQLISARKSYGESWCKRGGVGAYMNLARKWDRLDKAAQDNGYNIFDAIVSDSRAEGTIDDLRDLRHYLLLVEEKLMTMGDVPEQYVKEIKVKDPVPAFGGKLSDNLAQGRNIQPLVTAAEEFLQEVSDRLSGGTDSLINGNRKPGDPEPKGFLPTVESEEDDPLPDGPSDFAQSCTVNGDFEVPGEVHIVRPMSHEPVGLAGQELQDNPKRDDDPVHPPPTDVELLVEAMMDYMNAGLNRQAALVENGGWERMFKDRIDEIYEEGEGKAPLQVYEHLALLENTLKNFIKMGLPGDMIEDWKRDFKDVLRNIGRPVTRNG